MISAFATLLESAGVFCMAYPWDEWVPGVLNKNQMGRLLDDGFVGFRGSRPKLDHSSMDVSLSNEAYVMQKGAVKPSATGMAYDLFITQKLKLAEKLNPLGDGSYELGRSGTYVFRLQETLEAKLRNGGVIYGQATAKSSVGRVDVLARLIVDGMQTYECFDSGGLQKGSGAMFLEVTPITFNVRVRPDMSLSQLRFFYGRPDDVVIKGKELFTKRSFVTLSIRTKVSL